MVRVRESGWFGEMNGFNYPEFDVPKDATIKWFADWIKQQNKKTVEV